ncbi:MAG TPA: histidine kinase dimerization/phosphoacceptor domain -containing protein, partial [Methanocella sp.]
SDVSLVVEQIYHAKMDSDRMIAIRMSNDPGIVDSILRNDTGQVQTIVGQYVANMRDVPSDIARDENILQVKIPAEKQTHPDGDNVTRVMAPPGSFFDSNLMRHAITIMDRNGTVLTSSPAYQKTDRVTIGLLRDTLNGTGFSVTEVLPDQVIFDDRFPGQANTTITEDSLAIVNVEPVRDGNGTIIGAISISEVLNDGRDIVNTITDNTDAYCTVFQNDTSIATTLLDSDGRYAMGAKAPGKISSKVLLESKTAEGIYEINNLTLYVRCEPLANEDNATVGMLFVGYDVGPGLARLSEMREQGIATSLAALIIAIVIGYVIAGTITRPIKRIVTIANSIAAGNLDTPVDTGESGGEIGELSGAIKIMVNTMVTDIKERISFNQSVLESISDPMLVVDNAGKITLFNEPASRISGIPQNEALNRPMQDVFRLEPGRESMEDILESRDSVQGFEKTLVTGAGDRAIMLGTSAPVRNATGEIIGKIIMLHDVTKERASEEKIRHSLQEKEILLKEIHHRVKNNLQIISSLLSLQSGYITDKQTLSMFKEGQDRVKSMALIHEKLYESSDIARIDFTEYVKNLAGYLVRSYVTESSRVKLTVVADDISLEIDNAVPCGLIINELVTNSLKYAFPDGRRGEIRIELRRIGDPANNEYRMAVIDNGIGLPPEIDIRKTKSLGLQLVTMLTDQIHGDIQVSRENGTACTITFRDVRNKRNGSAR